MKFQNFYSLLTEMPIDKFELKGDWSPTAKLYGYDKPSTKLLTNPNYADKVRTKWNKTDYDFDLFFLRSKEGNKYAEVGEVPWEYVRDTLKLDIPIDHDHITIIYLNNKGDEKIPLTPWVIAHRFAHALARVKGMGGKNWQYEELRKTVNKMVSTIAKEVYNSTQPPQSYGNDYGRTARYQKIRLQVCHALGTMKSARDRNIRQEFELVNELIAQYIIEGKIKLNRELPKVLATSYAWGRPNGPSRMTKMNEELEDILSQAEDEINIDIDGVLGAAVNSIFVM